MKSEMMSPEPRNEPQMLRWFRKTYPSHDLQPLPAGTGGGAGLQQLAGRVPAGPGGAAAPGRREPADGGGAPPGPPAALRARRAPGRRTRSGRSCRAVTLKEMKTLWSHGFSQRPRFEYLAEHRLRDPERPSSGLAGRPGLCAAAVHGASWRSTVTVARALMGVLARQEDSLLESQQLVVRTWCGPLPQLCLGHGVERVLQLEDLQATAGLPWDLQAAQPTVLRAARAGCWRTRSSGAAVQDVRSANNMNDVRSANNMNDATQPQHFTLRQQHVGQPRVQAQANHTPRPFSWGLNPVTLPQPNSRASSRSSEHSRAACLRRATTNWCETSRRPRLSFAVQVKMRVALHVKKHGGSHSRSTG